MTGDHLRRQDNREAEVAQQVKGLPYKCDDPVNPQHLYKCWAGAATYLETLANRRQKQDPCNILVPSELNW